MPGRLAILFLIIRLFVSCGKNESTAWADSNDDEAITTNQIESIAEQNSDGSWGYGIFLDNKKIISQPNVPALPGASGFKTKEQAQQVAALVISKIIHNKIPPTVTIHELDSLGATQYPNN